MTYIEKLRRDCEYDPDEDSTLDDLIAYKDALEDTVARVEAALESGATTAQALLALYGDEVPA